MQLTANEDAKKNFKKIVSGKAKESKGMSYPAVGNRNTCGQDCKSTIDHP
jgi:hypothetical protein